MQNNSAYKELRHRVVLQTEDENLLLPEEINAFYAHSLVYPKKEPGIIESELSGSSMEPRFAIGHPELRKIAVKVIENRIKKYNIEQVAFPGIGGAMTALAWAQTGCDICAAHLRVDKNATHKRLKTRIEGFLSKDKPVWITDDVLTTGNGFRSAFQCLLESGYSVGGFVPLIAHEEGAGVRAAQCISMNHKEFIFSPIFLLFPLSKKKRPLTLFSSPNHVLFPNLRH